VPGTYFRMEHRDGGYFQTAHAGGRERSERFDLVIGSGRRGQSYLYWKGELLFQLPISYLAALDAWVNSPGFADGAVHFERLIPPRCLECHTSHVSWSGSESAPRYERAAVLGIACQKCHGGSSYVAGSRSEAPHASPKGLAPDHAAIRNPARLERDRQIDTCALCHSGIREPRRRSFTYAPGERLDEYLAPAADDAHAVPDVHGNQVGLLRASACFRSSSRMACASCHDVHRPERDLAALADRCGACHAATACRVGASIGSRAREHCIDCHMPRRPSRAISIATPGKPFAQAYRTHRVGVYTDASRAVLESLGRR